MLIITLDNSYIVPDEEHSDISDATISIKNDIEQGSAPNRNFASDIEFYGNAYNIIVQKLINDVNAFKNEVIVTIYDDCCDLIVFEGKITQDSIEFCEIGEKAGCRIEVTIKERSEESFAYKCLQETLISADFSNGVEPSFRQRQHPFMRYCYAVRPVFLHHLIINLGFGIVILIYGLIPIVLIWTAITEIINGLCDLFGDPCIDFDENEPGRQTLLDWYEGLIEDIREWLAGCGEGNISPFTRDFIRNACEQCGLTFQSSILTNPVSDYFNMVYFAMAVKPGQDEYIYSDGSLNQDTVKEYFDYNAPLLSGYGFLSDIAEFFNAKWWVKGSVVYLEPKSEIITPVWLDFTDTINKEKIIELCYEYTGDQQPSAARFQYTKDGMEVIGNEALPYYNDIVNYQLGGINPNLEGLKKYDFNFGATRFRQDGISADVLETYENLPIISLLIGQYQNQMLIHNGSVFSPKLIIWDNTTPLNHGLAQKLQYDFSSPYRWDYNYVMWFDECNHIENSSKHTNLFPGFCVFGNMYRFYHVEDPRVNIKKGLSFNLEMLYQCEDLKALYELGVNYSVIIPFNGQPVVGTVTAVTFKNMILTIEGNI